MKKIATWFSIALSTIAFAAQEPVMFNPATGDVSAAALDYNLPAGTTIGGDAILGSGLVIFDAASTLTISSGAITITQTCHKVGGEGAASDDLVTINGGSADTFLILRPVSSSQDITLKHGTGNILIDTGADYIIPDDGYVIMLYNGTNWLVSSSSGGGVTSFVGLSDTPANYTGSEGKLVAVNSTPDGVEFIAQSSLKLDDFAAADDNTDLNATASAHGLMPKLSGNTSQFFNGGGAWSVPPGGGDVVGPAGATDTAVALFDGVTGTLIKNSLATIDASGTVNIPTGQSYKINNVALAAGDVGAAATTTQIIAGTGLAGGGTLASDRTLSLSHLGIQTLADPNDDRIVFWDDGAGATAWLDPGSGIEIDGTTLKLGALTGNWDAGAYEIRAETLESDVATGTAPLTVASTTVVTNLNADLLDGVTVADLVADADFDAQTILAAVADNTPAAVEIGENDIVGRLPSGNIAGVTVGDLAEEGSPAAGDYLLGWEAGGGLIRKFDVGDLPYLAAEADTLDSVTGRGATTANAVTTGAITSGADGADGVLTLYSEQGGTDYSASINPHATMTSAAAFYLPADEPAATYLLNMTTGGQIGYDTNTYLTAEADTLATVVGRGSNTGNASITIGDGTATVDYTLTFNGEDNDGIITWLEDEDTFDLSCNVAINGGFLEVDEMAAPANPAANKLRIYSKDSSGTTKLYFRDSDGTETEVGAGGGGDMNNPMTTEGDMIYGGSDGTPTRLAVGTNGQALVMSSGVPTWTTAFLMANKTVNFDSSMTAAQMQSLINAEPKNLNGYTLTFQFADGTYNTSMTSALVWQYFYNGPLLILGNTGETVGQHSNQAVYLDFSAGSQDASIGIYYNSAPVTFSRLKIKAPSSKWGLAFEGNSNSSTNITGCYILSGGIGSNNRGIQVRSSQVSISGNYVDAFEYGIEAGDGQALIFSSTNTSVSTNNTYGLRAYGGTIIKGDATQPTGSAANELEQAGGDIR